MAGPAAGLPLSRMTLAEVAVNEWHFRLACSLLLGDGASPSSPSTAN